jgi:type I restriction enzyme R subunit
MPHAYTEDQLVELPAIRLFAELGWRTVVASEEVFGASGPLGRESSGEVVLVSRLRGALHRLNPLLPSDAIDAAVDELTRDRSAMSLVSANREVYQLLKDGIKVSVAEKDSTPHPGPLPGRGGEGGKGGQTTVRLRVVDWEHPANNDFLLVSQFSITGALYTRRPDLIAFINGLPLLVIELKKPGVPARAAFDDNLKCYKADIPHLFVYNALLIASNGTDSRVGSLTAEWERFFEWKRIEHENEPRRVSLDVMIRGTCDKDRLLDLVENFTLFSEHKAGLVKIIGQNHQFLGVNNAIASMLKARKLGHGRGGVFWQTQGSGKSFSMVFFAQKVLRKLVGDWKFVIATDRVELDEQISKTFAACGACSDAAVSHADSGANLRELLRGNHRYVFTLIHKFQTPEMLCDKSDVIVLTDEAHRSQYDTLAVNMRAALPNATFLAFTGTPLIAGEERTKEVFGDYVSIYDFQQSVEDGATVPLFYENRTPELNLVNPDLNDDIYNLIDAAALDDEQEAKLERELGRQYHILTRDDRLDTVAKDIVRHFLGRGFIGKAMVVSIDKATALRMYDKVRKFWEIEKQRVQKELRPPGLAKDKENELLERLQVLNTTDMALIVSPSQNEIEQMQKLGLDIVPHRKRINDSQPPLDEKFKDPQDPLRLVFVCAMWLTGFDAPSCSTVYLDKPMRNHTLMQTIARANRVFPGKHSGMIVDYANVFASLEKALAIYGTGGGGGNPVKDKKKLVADLRQAVKDAVAFCAKRDAVLSDIEKSPVGSMERLKLLGDAVNALIAPDQVRRDFFGHERLVNTLYGAVKPDPASLEFYSVVACLTAIGDAIRTALNPNPPDISAVMGDINKLLDESVEGVAIHDKPMPKIDLSKIDFEALAKRLKKSKHRNTDLEILKAAIRAQLEKLISLNKTRTDLGKKFEELIEAYNSGSKNIEDLLAFMRELSQEEHRHVREHMSEEELVILDILTRPAPELTTEERDELKKVAKQLLAKLKGLLVLDWRKRQTSQARVRDAIKDLLDEGLPRAYTPELYQQKCSSVYEHIYESYPQSGEGVYAGMNKPLISL